jgi:hypothetical protein
MALNAFFCKNLAQQNQLLAKTNGMGPVCRNRVKIHL